MLYRLLSWILRQCNTISRLILNLFLMFFMYLFCINGHSYYKPCLWNVLHLNTTNLALRLKPMALDQAQDSMASNFEGCFQFELLVGARVLLENRHLSTCTISNSQKSRRARRRPISLLAVDGVSYIPINENIEFALPSDQRSRNPSPRQTANTTPLGRRATSNAV